MSKRLTDSFRASLAEWRSDPDRLQGLPSGLVELDRLIGGFGAGELITVVAGTSMGKTSFLLELLRGFCEHLRSEKDARTVLMVSAEMSREKLLARLVASGLDAPIWRLPFLKHADVDAYLDDLDNWPMAILDKRSPTLDQVQRWVYDQSGCYEGVGESPVAAIIIDHLGKIVIPGVNDIYPKTSTLADEFFKLAGEYNCPVVLAAQANRNVEGRIGRDKDGNADLTMVRPRLSDVEGSGKVEQNSDVYISLFREERYQAQFQRREERKAPLEVAVLKSRNGATGTVAYDFDPEKTKLVVPRKPAVATPAGPVAIPAAAAAAALAKAKEKGRP